ncbi:MAG: hypothetical protein D6706_10915 [Chloroflexi bacterium]|nr:MAG: hypothetical protein D6706_10915 [Chloroflexota bacterium]
MLVVAVGLVACRPAEPEPVADSALVYETFTSGEYGPWLIEGDEKASTAVTDGVLLIEIHEPDTVQFATLSEPILSDFVAEVDARLLAGDTESSFGLLARMQGPNAFYRFEITASGLYMVERYNPDGTWTRFLPDWTPSPAINQGINVPNRLKLVAIGRSLSFYVNDVFLHQVADAEFVSGTIGLDAGTFGRAGLRVAFDNLVVKRP